MPTQPQQPQSQPAGMTPANLGALQQFDNLPDSANVRLPVVAALFGVGSTTVWRWVKAKRLPAAKRLGPNTVAWNVGELRPYLNAQQSKAA